MRNNNNMGEKRRKRRRGKLEHTWTDTLDP